MMNRTKTAVWALLSGVVATFLSCAHTPPVPAQVVVKRAQMHMGTLVSITAVAANEPTAQSAIAAGFHEIKRLERLLSTWISDSDLSRVNQSAGQTPVVVSRDTIELVARSQEMARMTDGAFNIAIGPAVDAWSVTERQRIPTDAELMQAKPFVDWTRIELNRTNGTLYLPIAGMRIDVGGIGKGYAADRAVDVMKKAGAQAGLVALAGDIKTFGSLPGSSGFPVGIQHPR